MNDFKERLRHIIDTFEGGSQANFRHKVGIKSSGHVNSWLTGASKPKYEYMKRICDLYNLSEKWLISGIGDIKKDYYLSGHHPISAQILESKWSVEDVEPQNDREKIIYLTGQLRRSEQDLYTLYDKVRNILIQTEDTLVNLKKGATQ